MMLIRSRDEANRENGARANNLSAGTTEQTIQLNESSSDFNHHHHQSNSNQVSQDENQQLINHGNQWPANHCSMMISNDGNNLWTLDNGHGAIDNGQRCWIPDVCPNIVGHQMDIGGQSVGNVWIQDMNNYPMTSYDPLLITPQLSECGSSVVKGDNLQIDTCNCHVTLLPGNGGNNGQQNSLQMYKVTTI